MKSLIIAEKPSVGKDIARVMGASAFRKGYYEGGQYIVTWAMGHLCELAEPEGYDKKYKEWNLNDLPIMPERLKTVVIGKTAKQYNTVKGLLLRADISGVIIATDAGREGELVARWIIMKAGCKKPIKRLWISSVTDKAIRDGFAKLRDGREYVSLFESAQARAHADWLVGINATRCLTAKHNAQLSCGRVQTPTLGLVAAREDEIRKFRPVKYFTVKALVGSASLAWRDPKSNETRIFDAERAAAILARVKTVSQGTVTALKKTRASDFSPPLYDLTELSRDANKRFGFSPKETLDICQALYERHKVLTYPRTDSRYLSTDIVPTLKDRLRAVATGQYQKIASGLIAGSISANSRFADNSKVSDHHAIIPTEERFFAGNLNDREIKIYDLVVRRFLAVLSPAREYEKVQVTVKLGQDFFHASGRTIIKEGWRAVSNIGMDEDEQSEQKLPPLRQGDMVKVTSVKMNEAYTSPPARFDEASLLSAMENPQKFMAIDKALAETLKSTGGLGTVATRADIIEKLQSSFLLEKSGKELLVTSKGRQLLSLVPTELRSPELTGQWERQLADIAAGRMKATDFVTAIRKYTVDIISEIKRSEASFRHENISGTKCPDCGKPMLEVSGKRGKMLVCQDRECGHRKSLSFITGLRCPTCKKRLETWGEGEKKQIICSCGFREKYDRFVERNASDLGRMNSRDVQGYLSKANAGAPQVNNAFAEALAKMKK